MKSFVVIGALIAFAESAAAEPLPVRLKDGAAWTLVVNFEREETRDGKSAARSSVTTYALTWRARKEGGRLTMKTVGYEPGPGTPPELAAAGQTGLVPIVLDVDEAVTPVGIVNEAEVRRSLEKMLAAMTKPGDGAAREIAGNVLDAALAELVTRDLAFVSLGQGTNLPLGERKTYEDSLPNPLGGPPIKTSASFRLDSYDAARGRAVVSWSQSLDPSSMRESVAVMLQSLAKDAPPAEHDKIRAMLQATSISREDICRHEIDIPTGLALKAECSADTKTSAGGRAGSRRDRWTFTQTLPDKR